MVTYGGMARSIKKILFFINKLINQTGFWSSHLDFTSQLLLGCFKTNHDQVSCRLNFNNIDLKYDNGDSFFK